MSEKLIAEQSDEIYGVNTIYWGDSSWIHLSLTGYVFSDSVLWLGKVHQNPQSNIVWEQRLGWLKSSQNYRNFDRIDCEPMEFEWNISQDSPHCSSATKSKSSCQK